MIGRGEVDFGFSFAGTIVYHLDAGLPITALGGLHRRLLRAVRARADPQHQRPEGPARRHPDPRLERASLPLASWPKHVGLDPNEDIEWVVPPSGDAMQRFIAGETDAFLGFPPEPQELRARGFSHVILEHAHRPAVVAVLLLHDATATAPASAIIRSRPSASCARSSRQPTFCAAEPEKAARRLVDGGFAEALRLRAPDDRRSCPTTSGTSTIRRTRCGSTRFACTRSGMIKSSPNAILADGTDWRFVNELKRELKA